MRHAREDRQLAWVHYDETLLSHLMEASHSRVQNMLSAEFESMISRSNKCAQRFQEDCEEEERRQPVQAHDEFAVQTAWKEHFASRAIQATNGYYDKTQTGTWRVGADPIHRLQDDVPHAFAPKPDFIISFDANPTMFPPQVAPITNTTPNSSNKRKAGQETPRDPIYNSNDTFGAPLDPNPLKRQLLTVEVKTPFFSPSILVTMSDFLKNYPYVKFDLVPIILFRFLIHSNLLPFSPIAAAQRRTHRILLI